MFKNVIPYLLFKGFTLKLIRNLCFSTTTSSLTKLNFLISFFLQSPSPRRHPAIQYQILKFSKMLYFIYFKIKEFVLRISEECACTWWLTQHYWIVPRCSRSVNFCGKHIGRSNTFRKKKKTLKKYVRYGIFLKFKIWNCVSGCLLDARNYKQIEITNYELGQWTFCGTHIQKSNKFSIKTLRKWVKYENVPFLKLCHNEIWCPLGGGDNEKT